jgi:hypothetical protein
MRATMLGLALALGVTGAASAGAQVIVDQSSAAAATVGGGINFDVSAVIANDFTLGAPATIRAASFFSLECCTLPWNGSLTYFFFTPSASSPFVPAATPFAQGTTSAFNVTTLYSDAATNVIRRFDFNLNAPLVLGAGSYFFGLMATNGPGSGPLDWRTVAGGGLSANTLDAAPQTWILQSGEAAFQLHGSEFAITATTAPEPATVLLLGGGLAAMGAVALRRRSRG